MISMNNTFLYRILPQDEYKRMNLLYYSAESALLAMIILGGSAIVHFYFIELTKMIDWILFMPFLMVFYITIRYIISGMEHTNVATKSQFFKKRHDILIQSLISMVVIFIVSLLFKGFPDQMKAYAEIVLFSVIFGLFFYLFNLFSLKKSYQMNKHLND